MTPIPDSTATRPKPEATVRQVGCPRATLSR